MAPVDISYTAEENQTWARVAGELQPLWQRHAADPLRQAAERLALPTDSIPQLSLVTERLQPLTGFRYHSVPGTVSGDSFFAALADNTFLSTQFIRWSGHPAYTPQRDVIHEVGGHANSLAVPQLAELHRLAGRAALAAPSQLTELAAVFWYSVEFGVLVEPGDGNRPKAYGTGLLSSPGELAWFADNAEIRPLDVEAMATTPYDITRYQPVLFAAHSLDHLLDVVGGHYASIVATGGRHGS
jgi:phenylalanine-4-hydroxylase